MADDLATELLVRILRDQKIDARHMSLEDLNAAPPPNAAEAVSIVYVVSAFPSEERSRGDATAEKLRAAIFPTPASWRCSCPACCCRQAKRTPASTMRGADKSAGSLGHAVQICLDMQPKPAQRMTTAMKTVLVTGAAQGLGLTTATLLAQRAYRVILVDIQSVEDQVARLANAGRRGRRACPAMSPRKPSSSNWRSRSAATTAHSTDW